MSNFEDYYEMLGVGPEATSEEISKVYEDKCWLLHPHGLRGRPEFTQRLAAEELKRVKRAYGVIGNPEKRQEYHSEWVGQKAKHARRQEPSSNTHRDGTQQEPPKQSPVAEEIRGERAAKYQKLSDDSSKKAGLRKRLGLGFGLGLTILVMLLIFQPWQTAIISEPPTATDSSSANNTVTSPELPEGSSSPVDIYNQTNEDDTTPPDDSCAVWNDNSAWQHDESIRVQGSVRNTHSTWSMEDVQVEVYVYDSYDRRIETMVIDVTEEIKPGKGVNYTERINPSSNSMSFDAALMWYWTPPY